MTDTLINPPRTIMEVFRMLPEGTLAEVIDNQLYIHQHQQPRISEFPESLPPNLISMLPNTSEVKFFMRLWMLFSIKVPVRFSLISFL